MSKPKISWRLHFIELVVVIIGITIAFTLEGWSEKRKENELEKAYLASMKSDIQKDIKDIESVIDSSNMILRTLGETFQYIFTNQKVESFKRRHITSTYTPPYFYPKNGTYLSLVNSGNLNIIKDFEVKSELSELYEIKYGELRRYDDIIRKLVDDMIYPYMIDNIEFSVQRDGIENASPLKANKARNMIGSYYNFLQSRNQIYTDLIAECDSLVKNVDVLLGLPE